MNNLEQLSKMIEHQSVLIEALTKKVEKQQAYINSHARKIQRMQNVIYQMCGKIYDHTFEMDYIRNYTNYMIYNNHSDAEFVELNESEPDE